MFKKKKQEPIKIVATMTVAQLMSLAEQIAEQYRKDYELAYLKKDQDNDTIYFSISDGNFTGCTLSLKAETEFDTDLKI